MTSSKPLSIGVGLDLDEELSLTDIRDSELDDGDYHDIDEAYLTDKQFNQLVESLEMKGFCAMDIHKKLMKQNGQAKYDTRKIEELMDAITTLGTLVSEYGNPAALDDLITLVTDMDASKTPGPLSFVESLLIELASETVLPIKDTESSIETPEQITCELQDQLMQALEIIALENPKRIKRILQAFKSNPNYNRNFVF